MCRSVLQCVAEYCTVLQCIAVCCMSRYFHLCNKSRASRTWSVFAVSCGELSYSVLHV